MLTSDHKHVSSTQASLLKDTPRELFIAFSFFRRKIQKPRNEKIQRILMYFSYFLMQYFKKEVQNFESRLAQETKARRLNDSQKMTGLGLERGWPAYQAPPLSHAGGKGISLTVPLRLHLCPHRLHTHCFYSLFQTTSNRTTWLLLCRSLQCKTRDIFCNVCTK